MAGFTEPWVVGIGETTLDQIGVGAEPDGYASELGTFTVQAGGAAGTALATVAALGGRARLFARFGDDAFGRTTIQRLRSFGVDTASCLIEPGKLSATQIILLDHDRRRRSVWFTRGDVSILTPGELPGHLLDDAGLLLLDGSAPAAQAVAAERARARGIKVMLDARHFASGGSDLWELADVVVASERFAAELAHSSNIEKALVELTRLGPSLAVITLGEDGAAALQDKTLVRQQGLRVEVVDKTGAGDAFRGALAWALARRWTVERALPFANAAGALNCRALGGQSGIPSLDEVLRTSGLTDV